MKRKAWFILLALLLLLPLLACSEAEKVRCTGVVTGGQLKLRDAPSSSGKVLGNFKNGTEVTVVSYGDAWCQVRVSGQDGFMMTEYLTLKTGYTPLGYCTVDADAALTHLFEQPDETSPCITCPGGVRLEVIEKQSGWYKLRLDDSVYYAPASGVAMLPESSSLQRFSPLSCDSFDISAFRTAPHDFGNMKRVSHESDGFSYTLTYPSLSDDTLDTEVYEFVNNSLSLFQQDYDAWHNGEAASFTVDYQAVQLDDRYQSVLVCGQYEVGNSLVHLFLARNLDTETGSILTGAEMFSALMRPVFYTGSHAAQVMPENINGYTANADESWLQYAVLTRDGVDVFLPGGSYLPLSAGAQRFSLEYSFLADDMAVDSAFIQSKRRVIDPTRPMIAITFDDGPSEYTDSIISVLAQYNARATFCVQGKNVEDFADTVCRAIAFGNEIASHTWDHPFLNKASASTIRWELEHTNEVISKVTGGYQVHVLRPPYGKHGATTRSICKDLGMIIAHWKVDTLDWKTRSTSKTYKAILEGAKTSGVIMLCHDIYPTTAEAVIQAIPELVADGIQLVTVSELMSFHVGGAKPGTVYAYLDKNNIDYSKGVQ